MCILAPYAVHDGKTSQAAPVFSMAFAGKRKCNFPEKRTAVSRFDGLHYCESDEKRLLYK